MIKNRLLSLFFLIFTVSTQAFADITLPHIIASHMVLQQQSDCKLWGWGSVDEKVTVKTSWGVETSTITDSEGCWQVIVKTPKAGGPYTIDLIGNNYISLTDVLIGEVWLAVGQANMGMPLMGWPPLDTVTNSKKFIAESYNEKIRLTNVMQKASFDLEKDVACWWWRAEPTYVNTLSALAYLYAKKINEETGVPVGIVTSTWSSSESKAWVDVDACASIPTLKKEINDVRNAKPKQKELFDWINSHPQLQFGPDYANRFKSVDFNDKDIPRLYFNDDKWPSMNLPGYMDSPEGIGAFDGVVWFRRWVQIPVDWVGKRLILSLGPIDDMDVTFVNGEKVGETLEDKKWDFHREYIIEPGIVRTDLLITIRVIDNGDAGGMYAGKEEFCVYPEGHKEQAISLAGAWKYLPTVEKRDNTYYIYDYKKMDFFNRPPVISLDMRTISGLYNGMIYPLKNFKFAGVICAMGENNVGSAGEYMTFFPALVDCWRRTFDNPQMPFYYTQISPWIYSGDVESFKLREAQRRCQYLIPNSGMTTTIDVALKASCQYSDKELIANRLAAWPLHDLYKKNAEVCGPEYDTLEIVDNKIIVSFTHTIGGLVSKDGKELRNFEVVDSKGHSYPARVEINGNKITVWSENCKAPKNVRYAYKDWVENVNFYNGAGFPASSFTTEKKVGDSR